MTMVERVARVFHPNAWDGDAPHLRAWSLGIARQAIAAMRKPTNPMVTHGRSERDVGSDDSELNVIQTWQAMIDAALKEEPKP